ncbi:MAG: hypothetical protein ABSG25_08315 [Bryobacteraceae bacterium]
MSPSLQHYDFANQLLASKEFFERSTRVLDEADSGFRPREGMMTVAQQVAHAAQTLDWFIEGASRREGFDLDFAKHAKALEGVTSLAAARQMLETAYANAIHFLGSSGFLVGHFWLVWTERSGSRPRDARPKGLALTGEHRS